jgi:hypothetical protein
MKEFLSLFTFGMGAFCFVVFFTALKPDAVTAAVGGQARPPQRGYVAKSGSVRASVTVQDKYASGTGKLAARSGHGTWSGHSGTAQCSGYWTAQRH